MLNPCSYVSLRVGPLDQATESQIRSLPLSRLEDLGEALLEFSQLSDLSDWLTLN
jgi:Domain of unknown function (DUF4351)